MSYVSFRSDFEMNLDAVIFFVFIPQFVLSGELPCDERTAIDISDGQVLSDHSVNFDGLRYSPRDYGVRNDTMFGCVCNLRSCIRKCCPSGQFLYNRSCEANNKTFGSVGGSLISGYSIINGNECLKKSRLLLDPREEHQVFHLRPDGGLEVPSHKDSYGYLDYCVDYIQEEDVVKALVCVEDPSAAQYYWIGTSLNLLLFSKYV